MKPHRFSKEKRPHLFAHRGGNQAGAKNENSMAAFKSAVKLGYKFIETDVILTKDGQVICFHGSLNRISKWSSGFELRRKVRRMTYAEVKRSKLLDGEVVPKLEDVLKAFPDTYFSIDTKTVDVVAPLAEIIKKLKAENRVIITSFGLFRTLKANQLINGDEKQASLCLNKLTTSTIRPFSGVFCTVLAYLGIRYLQMPYSRLTKGLVKSAQRRGIRVYAWTVNKEEDIRQTLSTGVDGVMSDESVVLLKVHRSKRYRTHKRT